MADLIDFDYCSSGVCYFSEGTGYVDNVDAQGGCARGVAPLSRSPG